MFKTSYKRGNHYLNEFNDLKTPKKKFIEIIGQIDKTFKKKKLRLLDIGSANGEFLNLINNKHPSWYTEGIETQKKLIRKSMELTPKLNIINCSVLDLKKFVKKKFDVVTAIGLLQIFDEKEVIKALDNINSVLNNRGHLFILSPFNKYGIDMILKFNDRKVSNNLNWQSGWNIFSIDFYKNYAKKRKLKISIVPFELDFKLKETEDKIRTWTIKTKSNPFQLTNGLQLLVDLYIIKLSKNG